MPIEDCWLRGPQPINEEWKPASSLFASAGCGNERKRPLDVTIRRKASSANKKYEEPRRKNPPAFVLAIERKNNFLFGGRRQTNDVDTTSSFAQ
jgi:hypothetical protein